MHENSLGQKSCQKGEDPPEAPVPEPLSGEQRHHIGHKQSQQEIDPPGRIEQRIFRFCEQPDHPHGIALEHIGQDRLESIGKAVSGNTDALFIAIGERAVFCDILRDKIAVKLVRRVAEGLLYQQGKPQDEVEGDIAQGYE